MIKVIFLAILLIIGTFILNKRDVNREKLSTYESGFQAFDDSRNKFYVKYFLVGIIFLIFDLETMLVYPFSYILDEISILGYLVFLLFFIILIVGLLFELYKGLL